jgi:hypothetical protein
MSQIDLPQNRKSTSVRMNLRGGAPVFETTRTGGQPAAGMDDMVELDGPQERTRRLIASAVKLWELRRGFR